MGGPTTPPRLFARRDNTGGSSSPSATPAGASSYTRPCATTTSRSSNGASLETPLNGRWVNPTGGDKRELRAILERVALTLPRVGSGAASSRLGRRVPASPVGAGAAGNRPVVHPPRGTVRIDEVSRCIFRRGVKFTQISGSNIDGSSAATCQVSIFGFG